MKEITDGRDRIKITIIAILGVVSGLALGYTYGFNAYNRPIRRWEFWQK